MTDRYAVHGAQGEFQPGSNDLVLANKLGIQSPEDMDELELELLQPLNGESGRQLDVCKPVLAAVFQLLFQLLHALPRFQRGGTCHSPAHGLQAGLGRLWGGGDIFEHGHIGWLWVHSTG